MLTDISGSLIEPLGWANISAIYVINKKLLYYKKIMCRLQEQIDFLSKFIPLNEFIAIIILTVH